MEIWGKRLEECESEIQNIDVEKCKQSIEHFIIKKSEKLSKKDCVINSFGDPWVKVSNDGILYCYINTEVTIDGEKESLPMYVEIASGVNKGS